MLTCLRRKPVKEEQAPYNEQDPDDKQHSHHKYAFDNDQAPDEEQSLDNSRQKSLMQISIMEDLLVLNKRMHMTQNRLKREN